MLDEGRSAHLSTAAADVVSVRGDGRQASYEFVMRNSQVVYQLPSFQVPHKERKRLLSFVATHANAAIIRDDQRVKKTVFANLKIR